MSFWDLTDGENVSKTDGEFDTGGGSFEVIPNNTDVLACVDEAKWNSNEAGDKFISLRWTILKPEQHANRKVFQKLWVLGNNPMSKTPGKQAEKAKRMLAAIGQNAGGKLTQSNEQPTDQTLTMCLVNKPMVIKLMIWELIDDHGKPMDGNWVCAVSPKTKELTATGDAPKIKTQGSIPNDIDDSIPF